MATEAENVARKIENVAEKFGSKFENVVLGLVSWLVAREGNEGFYHQQNLPSSNCILIKWPNLQIL